MQARYYSLYGPNATTAPLPTVTSAVIFLHGAGRASPGSWGAESELPPGVIAVVRPALGRLVFFVLRTSASILALHCALIVFKLPRALTKKPSEGYVYVAQCSLQPVQATQRAM